MKPLFIRRIIDAGKREGWLGRRSDYKSTWQSLTGTIDEAKLAVAGCADEDELNRMAEDTLSLLDRLVGIRSTDVCLEIGCGVGRVGKVLAQHCAKWIGTDISPNMLGYAAERLRGLPNIQLIELGTVGLSEIPDQSIDVVYCTVVFMHLLEWDRWRYVAEAFRVLRPGGRCLFDNVDITSNHGWEIFQKGAAIPIQDRPSHLSMTSSGDELETYALKAGFAEVRIHRWDRAWVGVTGMKPIA